MVGAGYLTSNSGTPWPFDPSSRGFSLDAARLFADMSASVGDGPSFVRVAGLRVSGGEVLFSVEAVGGDGAVLRSASAAVGVSGGSPYSVFNAGWVFAVVDCAEALRMDGFSLSSPMALDPSAVNRDPDVVTSLTLVNPAYGSVTPSEPLDPSEVDGGEIAVPLLPGGVGIVGGYNVKVEEGAGSGTYGADLFDRDQGFIMLSASPGEGAGQVPADCPECGDRLGNVKPDRQGDVLVEGDGCYSIVPAPQGLPDTVRLVGRCVACCTCDQFVEAGNRLAGHGDRILKARSSLFSTAGKYNSWARKFNDSLHVVSADELVAKASVSAQVTGVAGSPGLSLNGVSGTVDRAQGVLALKNMSTERVKASVSASMSPHSIVAATLSSQAGVSGSTVSNASSGEPVVGGAYRRDGIVLESGGSATVRFVGTRSGTGYSGRCELSGRVVFTWMEPSGQKRLARKFVATYGEGS